MEYCLDLNENVPRRSLKNQFQVRSESGQHKAFFPEKPDYNIIRHEKPVFRDPEDALHEMSFVNSFQNII